MQQVPTSAGERVGLRRFGPINRPSLSHLALLSILAFVALFFAHFPAAAIDFPPLSGRVVDEAGILNKPTREALTGKLADLEAKTTDQLVVVTLKSLQGTSIEDFGVQLGRAWQIGQKDKNNGVLLIVVPSERRVRIEVGYGLEGTLTDAISRVIIENAIIPRFRADDFAGGVTRGVDDIIQVLAGDAEEWKQRAAQRPETPNESVWPLIVVVLVVLAVLVFCFTLAGVICDALFQLLSILTMFTGKGSSGSGSSWSGGGGSFGGGGASGRW
jgi:uncharacterized protein